MDASTNATSTSVEKTDWASKLPPIPKDGGVLVDLFFENIPYRRHTHMERRFPKKSTVWDVINLCHAEGLEEGTFTIMWDYDDLRGSSRNYTMEFLDARSSEGIVHLWVVPNDGGILLQLTFENIPGFSNKKIERRFPSESTLLDVVHLCHAEGLEEDTFDIIWRSGPLRGSWMDRTLGFINERYSEGMVPLRVVPKQ